MDAKHFDRITQSLGEVTSRRRLGGLAATLALTAIGLPVGGLAKQKRKRKKAKLVFNAFGCVNVGQACRGNGAHCCSGVCDGAKPKKGKKDTSRCVEHNGGGCDASFDASGGVQAVCGVGGQCFRTTGEASVCGLPGSPCRVCKRDADCQAILGTGAACVVCPLCSVEGTACVAAAV